MTEFDPDAHFVVVRSKRTGEHHHVDLRVLDRILDAIPSQAAPQTGRFNSDVAALQAQVERLTRDLQELLTKLDTLERVQDAILDTNVLSDVRVA